MLILCTVLSTQKTISSTNKHNIKYTKIFKLVFGNSIFLENTEISVHEFIYFASLSTMFPFLSFIFLNKLVTKSISWEDCFDRAVAIARAAVVLRRTTILLHHNFQKKDKLLLHNFRQNGKLLLHNFQQNGKPLLHNSQQNGKLLIQTFVILLVMLH